MNKELEFPIIYDLRVIYRGSWENGNKKITRLLDDLCIDYRPGILKPGGKTDLIRIGINITLTSKGQMDTLYNNLNTIPEVKWAT